MTKGHFTKSGHFIVLRGVQDEKILVADPASYRRSQKAWDLSIILNEASRRAGAGGPRVPAHPAVPDADRLVYEHQPLQPHPDKYYAMILLRMNAGPTPW